MNTLYKYSILFFIFFSPFFSFAQQEEIDSLLSLLKNDKEDTGKVRHLSTLCTEFWSIGQNDTALVYGNSALRLAERLDHKPGIASASNNLGFVFGSMGNYPKALEFYFTALAVNEKLLLESEKKGDKEGAMQKKIKIGKNLTNIGIVYEHQKDFKKALAYYLKSINHFYEANDQYKICVALGNIGVIYVAQGDTLKGEDCYKRAMEIALKIGKQNEVSRNLGNIGSIYFGHKEYEKALEYLNKALELSEKNNEKYKTPIWLNSIGAIYMHQGKHKEAEAYLQRALKMYTDVDDKYGIMQTELDLSRLYEKTGKFDISLSHYKLFVSVKDSLFDEEKNKEITRNEMTYEFEKKEAAAKAEADKQAAISIAEKRKQEVILNSVFGGFAVVLLFAGFIFRSLRTTRKQKQLIEKQKHLVEEKQKEILDSIHYARRIQTALLPTEKYIDKSLKRLMQTIS